MIRHTKIVATLGPATEDKTKIRDLVDSGMNIARLNFSHGNYEQFKKIVQNIHEVEKETGKRIAILQDLQGPKIRLGKIEGDQLQVHLGETITFSTKAGEKGTVHLPYLALPNVVKPGQSLLIEDGLIRTKILSISGHHVKAEVIVPGILKSNKGVNIPDTKLPHDVALTEKDQKDLRFGIKTLKVDAVALSFVDDPDDVIRTKKLIKRLTRRPVMVIAKIERQEALRNLKKIIEVSDGIMVARGDLGIEIEAERVPVEQKRMLALARREGKPVIIATQILQSMVESPLATRAEISDAANAIFDHADAFMLSNETAVGKYPVRAVKTLARVAHVTEEAIFKDTDLTPAPLSANPKLLEDESLAREACVLADKIKAEAIVVLTREGFTARTVLKHRPENPIIVVTNSEGTARQLTFLWGIEHILVTKGALRSEEAKELVKRQNFLPKASAIVLIKLSDKKRSLVAMRL